MAARELSIRDIKTITKTTPAFRSASKPKAEVGKNSFLAAKKNKKISTTSIVKASYQSTTPPTNARKTVSYPAALERKL
jgi:hypothetical protein